MKVTKERGILCAVMIAGLVVLAFDQLGGGPSTAGANIDPAAPSPDLYAVPRADPSAIPQRSLPSTRVTVAQQLRSVWGAEHRPGASVFVVSNSWEPESGRAPTADNTIARFLEAHRLEAILVSDAGGLAIINGRAFRPGQVIDGLHLASVGKSSVVLEYQSHRIALRLDRPDPGSRGQAARRIQ